MVGLAVTALALLVKSRHRMRLALVAGLALAAAVQFMPEHWHARIASIFAYEEDASAQARIASWRYGLEVAREHPVVGGGFEVFRGNQAATPAGYRSAHSIYFEMLGEHGWVGRRGLPCPRFRRVPDRTVGDPPRQRGPGALLGGRSRIHGPGEHRGLCDCRIVSQSGYLRPVLSSDRDRRHRIRTRTTEAGITACGCVTPPGDSLRTAIGCPRLTWLTDAVPAHGARAITG